MELSGIASNIPFAAYPGLPAGIEGIAQWSGRIFPVLAVPNTSKIDLFDSTFLFSNEMTEAENFKQVALAVPGRIRVILTGSEKLVTEQSGLNIPSYVKAIVTNTDGEMVFRIGLKELIEFILMKNEGVKVAA
jgi:hypothetical protein